MSILIFWGGEGGQAQHAELSIEVAWGQTWRTEGTLDWTDISAWVEDGVSWRLGRSKELDTFQTGSASFTVINDNRYFDPAYTAGPWYGQLLPRVPCRIRATPASAATGGCC